MYTLSKCPDLKCPGATDLKAKGTCKSGTATPENIVSEGFCNVSS